MSCYTRACGGRARGRSLTKPEPGYSEVMSLIYITQMTLKFHLKLSGGELRHAAMAA